MDPLEYAKQELVKDSNSVENWRRLAAEFYKNGLTKEYFLALEAIIDLSSNREDLIDFCRQQDSRLDFRESLVRILVRFEKPGVHLNACELVAEELGKDFLASCLPLLEHSLDKDSNNTAIAACLSKIHLLLARYRSATSYLQLAARNEPAACFPMMNIRQYCHQYADKYNSIQKSKSFNQSPIYLYGEQQTISENELKCNQPELYMAELRDCTVFGGSDTIVSPHNLLLSDLIDFVDADSIKLNGCDPIVWAWHRHAAAISGWIESGKTLKQAISLLGLFSFSWSHWLIEFLPRFSLLDKFPEYDNVPILVDEAALQDPQMLEAFQMANYKGREVITIKIRERCHVESMIYPSKLSSVTPDLKAGTEVRYNSCIIAPEVSAYLEKLFAPYYPQENDSKSKLYLGRKGAGYRSLVNESEVEAVFLKRGFTQIEPAKITLREKIRCFHQASVLGGPGSSAFTNAIFCGPNTKLFFLIPEVIRRQTFLSNICHAKGQKLVGLLGEPVANSNINKFQSDYFINIAQLEKCLDNYS